MASGAKILVTGATGQVGFPVAMALSRDNHVWAVSRFTDRDKRASLEAAGATCVPVDLAGGEFSNVPADVDYLVNFAVSKSNDWERDIAANAEAIGLLMAHCRTARAVLHCSSTAVYQPKGHDIIAETDPLGDNHRVWQFLSTYSISKIAAEAVVRTMAREFGMPTTIARLNVPYGDTAGWPAFQLEMLLAGQAIPVHVDQPSLYNPLHDDDIIAQIEPLLAAADVPATIVNWAGPDTVSIEEWCTYLGELVGVEPKFVPTDQTIQSVACDTTKLDQLVGSAQVKWRDGFRRMVETLHPDRLR
jgi:nucleoside-diphosphate-sugar epimerase